MKKIILSLLLTVASCSFLWAKEVPNTTARTVGYHFLSQKGDRTLNNAEELQLIYAPGYAQKVFYVYATDHSFVIVSGDDAVEPILGYATDNIFKVEKMPAQVAAILDGFAEQIQYATDLQSVASPATADRWRALIANEAPAAAKTTAVTPLMTTKWNQSPYYNADCPYDYAGGGRSVSGCVATAMTQVMKFWNWPATGTGIHSYTSSCCGTLSANFGSTTYNWSAMPNIVSSPNAAVAKITSHVGISINMNYSASSSGAFVISSASPITYCTEHSLKTFFNYAPSLQGVARSSYTESAWKNLLKTELDAGRPVIMAGYGSGGGHCFVADGYDASDYFHMNWGWGGTSDGYFNINALNPGSLGTGGGSGGFNSNQQAVIGVRPNSTTVASTLQLNAAVTPSASSIFYTNPFSVSTNVANAGTSSFTGTICAAAFNSSGTFVTYIDSLTGVSIPAGFMTGTISFSTAGLLSMLPGSYTIGIFYRTGSGGWVSVANAGSYTNFSPMDVVNHNPIQMASNMVLTPTTFVQGSAASVNLNLQNDDFVDFTGSYDVSLYNLDGSFNSNIQTMTGMSLPSGYSYLSPYLTFSTTSITAAPGTYLLAATYNDGTGWYLCGTDYFINPIYVTVTAPPPAPDMYEANNTVATAYNLPLTFTGDVASKSTTGSNIHLTTDNDYYKIVLGSGYDYSITARINDVVSADDGGAYTIDAVWSYSTDGGTNWSSVYNDVMSGTISLGGGTGGTVLFRVSPAFAGNLGKYLLKLTNITRVFSSSVADVALGNVLVYPNPATDLITVDVSKTGATAISVKMMDMQGRVVYVADAKGKSTVTIPSANLPSGNYFISLNTDAGNVQRKVVIAK